MARPASLETAVMQILWDASPNALDASAVKAQLAPDHQVAYTTAMTVLVRLWEKGRLGRVKVGRAYAYSPTESQPEYEARRMAEILHSVDDRSLTLTRFLEALTDDERAALGALISES